MHPLIESNRKAIAGLCRRDGVRRLDVFGSILRDDFDLDASDVDFVVEFESSAAPTFMHLANLKESLEKLLQRPVDLVELGAVRNKRLRRHIEASKVEVFASTPRPAAVSKDPRTCIVDAIRKRVLLEFSYNGHPRIVAPYCFGVSTRGSDVLRAVQIGGSSPSGGMGFGKLWLLSQMRNLRMLDQTFVPDDPNYNPNDSAMKTIYSRI